MNDLDLNNKKRIMCVFELYKIAIDARKEHYNSYNTWVNLYAIFNGALLVALYSLKKEDFFFVIVINCVGIFASLSWYLSVTGYYDWIISWIKVVHNYEDELNNTCTGTEKSTDCDYCCCCLGSKSKFYIFKAYLGDREKKEYVSTQKTTKLFVKSIIIGWNVVFFYNLYKLLSLFPIQYCMIVLFVVLLEFYYLKIYRKRHLLSYIDEMKSEISEKR